MMMRRINRRRWSVPAAILSAGAICVGAVVSLANVDSPPTPDMGVGKTGAMPASNGLTAADTCATANCHGAATGETWRQAYRIWASEDPHADAYLVLNRYASQQMVRKLNQGQTLEGDAYRRFVDRTCAPCHATTIESHFAGADASVASIDPVNRAVTCSACHGDPESWLEGHLAMAGKRPEKSRIQATDDDSLGWRETNAGYGLRDLEHEITRARTCVGCHVGSAGDESTPARDVNHDLIAAGHPRLAFEYSSHLANMPHHWDQPSSVATDQLTRQWAIGQLVAAEAAAELLAARAESGVWPEFSEYDCAGCHHRLHGVDERTAEIVRSRTRNGFAYDWGSWYYPFAAAATEDGQALRQKLKTLKGAMSPLAPNREEVQKAVVEVRRELRRAIDNAQSQPDAVTQAISLGLKPPASWDVSAQAYLWHAQRLSPDEPAELLDALRALEPASEVNGPLWPHATENGVLESLQKLDR